MAFLTPSLAREMGLSLVATTDQGPFLTGRGSPLLGKGACGTRSSCASKGVTHYTVFVTLSLPVGEHGMAPA